MQGRTLQAETLREINDQYYQIIAALKQENALLRQQRELNRDVVLLALSLLERLKTTKPSEYDVQRVIDTITLSLADQ